MACFIIGKTTLAYSFVRVAIGKKSGAYLYRKAGVFKNYSRKHPLE